MRISLLDNSPRSDFTEHSLGSPSIDLREKLGLKNHELLKTYLLKKLTPKIAADTPAPESVSIEPKLPTIGLGTKGVRPGLHNHASSAIGAP